MTRLKHALHEGVVAGSVASILSTLALVLAGHRQNGACAAPVNAISHWLWDRRALREDGVDARHTATGYLIHHVASIWWATWHSLAWGGRPQAKRPAPALVGASVAAAVACFVDFKLTPKRLTPGFEHRLSTGALLGVYACFGLGLALASMAMRPAPEHRLRRCSAPDHARGCAPARWPRPRPAN
jgi:hypothetical protein